MRRNPKPIQIQAQTNQKISLQLIKNRIKHFSFACKAWLKNLSSISLSFLFTLLVNFSNTATASVLNNQMAGQQSQYLAMHAKDPVHWQEWNQKTLQLAQNLNRPILLSSGYFACHWCHVMQQENYQSDQTAQLINQHFVAVKIDRELNPELDQAMIDFAKQSTGQGGWPQHVLLTPNGYPFSAFIYLPNPSFNNYLKRVSETWQHQGQQITTLARQSLGDDTILDFKETSTLTYTHLKADFFATLKKNIDDLSGGLKSTAKFPRAPLLNNLLSMPLDETTEDWLLLTLDMMQSEHLRDHIHGGFYRYTVDPEWQIPHFEKMTYNNALLAKTYLLAGHRYNRQDYLKTASKTLEYLRKDLFNSQAGLYQSSYSAIDENGIEGADYLFSQAQLQKLLTEEEFTTVASEWKLSSPPPYEHGWHPKPIDNILWPQIKEKLKQATGDIPKDYKNVLSWNGLMLSALSTAARVMPQKNYQEQASSLTNSLLELITQESPPRAISMDGKNLGQATLEDYAFILQGLEDYLELSEEESLKDGIAKIKQAIVAKFYRNNQWYFEEQPLLPTMENHNFIKDEVLPSALAMVHCLVEGSLHPYHSYIQKNSFYFSSLLRRAESLNCKAH